MITITSFKDKYLTRLQEIDFIMKNADNTNT